MEEPQISQSAVASLCARCSTIDFDALHSSNPRPDIKLGPSSNWLVDSCAFCGFLATQISPEGPRMRSQSYRLQSTYDGWASSLEKLFDYNKKRWRGGTFLHIDPTDRIFQHLTTDSDNSRPEQLRLLEVDSIDFEMLRHWLSFCHESHPETCDSWKASIVPQMKLIDCQTLKIVPATNEQYVTLSYIWGLGENEALSSDAMPSQLPNTIKDAIAVTQQLGFRYLWIDRYCIDQQNQTHAMQQIEQMGSIYKYSEITIIAACGIDPSYGLPGIGVRHRKPHPKITIGKHLFISTWHTADTIVKASHWATRAWTYQEGLLSRRRLIFTDEQVYFQCESMYCYEIFDVPVGATRKPKNEPMNLRNFREQEHLLRIFPSLMDNTRINVFDMIEQYSARSLTRSTDKLNGFLGVLQAFHISPSGLQSFWGTPIAQNNTRFLYWEYRSVQTEEEKHSSVGFISGLCWTFYVEPVREKSLPSWSWVGWIGEIEYPAMIEYEPNRDSLEVKVCVELSDGTVLDWNESRRRYPKIEDQLQFDHFIHISVSALSIEAIRFPFTTTRDHMFTFNLDNDQDGCFFQWRVYMKDYGTEDIDYETENIDYEAENIESTFKAIVLSEGIGENHYCIYVMIVATVNGALERVGGAWLLDGTPVVTKAYLYAGTLKTVYGDEWYKHLTRTYGTWRIR